MPPRDHKTKVPTLKLSQRSANCDLLRRKPFERNYFKDYQQFEIFEARSFSPLRPWGAELAERKCLKSSCKTANCQLPSITRKKMNKTSEKLITISLKAARNEIGKKEKTKDFVHHKNLTDYIKEYRQTRHHLTEAERRQGSQKVLKAYRELSLPKSNQMIKYDDPSYVDVYYGSKKDDEDDASSDDTSVAALVESQSFESLPSQQVRICLPDVTSPGKKRRKNFLARNRLLDLAKMVDKRTTLIRKESNESNAHYRLSSLEKRKLTFKSVLRKNLPDPSSNSVKTKHKTSQSFLPKIAHTSIANTETSEEFAAAKLSVACQSNSTGREDIKLPPIPEEYVFKPDDDTVDDRLFPAVKTSQSCPVLRQSKDLVSSCLTNAPYHRNQSIREMLLATVTELQPFSTNYSVPEQEENSDDVPQSEPKPPLEIKKESISYQIFRSLSHKPSMKKLMEKFYVPIKEKSFTKNNCFVSGKRFQKLPSLSTSCPHLQLSKKLNKRKVTFEKYREQRLQAKENRKNLKQLMALEQPSKISELAITSNYETVVKSTASERNMLEQRKR